MTAETAARLPDGLKADLEPPLRAFVRTRTGVDRAGAEPTCAATSPYLLQHADNPVDWREWGEEAFAEAQQRDVPLLISIGYAACHWCQVTSM